MGEGLGGGDSRRKSLRRRSPHPCPSPSRGGDVLFMVGVAKDKSMTDEQLLELARSAARKAYAPYSNFHVGCAVESVDGDVVTGANMENACYRLGICAEQSALTAAQHKFGLGKVARLAVAGGSGDVVCTPCGGCRQAILEAAQLGRRDVHILCSSGSGSVVTRHRISELLP